MGTVSKALDILSLFTSDSSEIGLSEFSRLTKKNKATVYRYLCELESSAFVEQNSETKKYRLGAAIPRLARSSEDRSSNLQLLAPILETLSREASCWAFLYSVTPDPLVPLLVFDSGNRREATFAEIPPYSSPGACLAAVTGHANCAAPQAAEKQDNWKHAVDQFHAQGVAATPDAEPATIQSLSAPVFGVSATAQYIVTLSRDEHRNTSHEVPLKPVTLLAARSGTAAIGGCAPPAAQPVSSPNFNTGSARSH